jgi:hypothetical protein
MRCHGKVQLTCLGFFVLVAINTGQLLWVSNPRHGSAADITNVRMDGLADVLRITEPGRPDSSWAWVADKGLTGISNMRKAGACPT